MTLPVHPRDRFRKLAATEDKVKFLKQVPLQTRDMLRRAKKQQKEEVEFIKQVPVHPRDRLKKKQTNKLPHIRNI